MEPKVIGGKIAQARKSKGLSQAQLAEQLFISPQAVGKWERGESVPDILMIGRLAQILEVDLNYFATDPAQGPPPTPQAPTAGRTAEAPEEDQADGPKDDLNWNMSRGNWVDADFSGLKGLHGKFSSSNMKNCKFIGSDLSGLLLRGNNIEGCDFSGADITASHIQRSNVSNDVFKGCSFLGAEFSGSNIGGCDFSGADITGGHIQRSNVSHNVFKDCSLVGVELVGSNIGHCDLSGADLTGALIRSSGFEKNILTNTVLDRTVFKGTSIDNTVFEGIVKDCQFEDCSFTKVVFQNVTLTNTFFKGPSLKKCKFIGCQADRITYEFLRSAKADLSGITLIGS